MRIAIVGAGISGSVILQNLLDSSLPQDQLQIDVYEPRQVLVVGFPYDIEAPGAIMNEHALDLTIDDNKPEDFLDWLKENYPEWADSDAFVPRTHYGEYLHDHFISCYSQPNVAVKQEKIINLQLKDPQYLLQTEDETWQDAYDAVFFTIGHPPYSDHYDLIDTPKYIHDPYPIYHQLNKLERDEHIAVIGSGLTSLDVLTYLLNNYQWKYPIQCFVPNEPFKTVKFKRYNGELQFSFGNQWIEEQADAAGYIPLEVVMRQLQTDLEANDIDWERLIEHYGTGTMDEVRRAISQHDEELIKLRRYLVMLSSYLPDLYNALTPSDRDYYSEHYEEIFNHFRNQMPVSSLESILNWVDEGRLEIISGIKDIDYDEGFYNLRLQNMSTYMADTVINAAGFELDLTKAVHRDPLLKNLYDEEILTPYYRKGVMVTWPHCQIVTPNQGALENVFLLGQWISGIHYANNNIHLCMKQARRVAHYFLDKHTKHEVS